jgi:hypothetical protein
VKLYLSTKKLADSCFPDDGSEMCVVHPNWNQGMFCNRYVMHRESHDSLENS